MADTKDEVKDETVVEETEETEEVATGEESTEETSEEEEISEAELKETKSLYKLLKDPTMRDITIRTLAEKAGLLGKNAPETKQDVKTAKKDILAVLNEELGDKFEFFTPQLAKAIERVLESERQEQNSKLSAIEQSQVEAATNAAWDKLSEETKGLSRKFESKMVQLADELLPGPNQTPLQYLRRLYTIASADRQSSTTRQQMAEKINKNSKDAPGRLHSGSVAGVKTPASSNTKVSLDDAVRNAYENIIKGHNK